MTRDTAAVASEICHPPPLAGHERRRPGRRTLLTGLLVLDTAVSGVVALPVIPSAALEGTPVAVM
ncbi:hypothetical protein [Nonomuraea sp. NPDC048916]|uniref:hypothetical protein n=1 Tax=Nonomuraea sp. NPDC048916 TaxID=3154232 RepID=UPI0033F4F922